MADALCGPSHPLQNFQKHATVDRTLQQDRIAPHRPLEEGFRSSPGPNAGILDAEFEAFQAGGLDGALQSHESLGLQNPSASSHAETKLPGWASDFRNLHLTESRASPIPQAQFRHEAPIQRTAPGSWHQEFLRQQQPGQASYRSQKQSYNGSYGAFGPPAYNTSDHMAWHTPNALEKQPEHQQVEEVLDEDAMERAFEALSQDQLLQVAPQSSVNLAQDLQEMHPSDEIRIGSDRILDESRRDNEEGKDKNDADELAKTAGQLLDNVKHDQSKKFQQSSFLSLMRQIRDREVHVEGDKLVDTPQPLHPGGLYYPSDPYNPISGPN